MIELAPQLGLPAADLRFQYDTFELLAVAREYFFRPFTRETAERLADLARRYAERHPVGYRVILNFTPTRLSRRRVRRLLLLLTRQQRGYRLVDRLFTVVALAWAYPLFRRFGGESVARFAETRAMGLKTVLR